MTSIATATCILIWSVIEDLRSRKFSNRSFLIACAVAVVLTVATGGAHALLPASLGFAAGLVFFLPLVLIGVVGAGDMKLMAAVGILIGWHGVLWTGVYGLIWGALLGLVQIVVKGQLRTLIQNLTSLAIVRSKSGLQLHHIPFTAPLLLGWLSHLVLSGALR
ncbi:MAG: prepilin peptidase [Bdellovibrionales bacterium]|jgi:prepilin peptidase CpaA|nr:prepilin peptidase [Bdellovibrionales bacterium]